MSEMEMVDRVAEAIENCFALRARPLITAEDVALAAIKAMREPTDAMLNAGHDADPLRGDGYASCESHYRAMIDEALK